MDANLILRVENLTKTYAVPSGQLAVLKDVSFDLAAGATLAIVGPSGSGKTTLLGLCAGLDRATRGSVVMAGHALDLLNEDARARLRNQHVGFMFQSFNLLPTLTALENVLVPMELRGRRGGEPEARELLSRVGLAERCDHFPAQLSGGEQQRVALARAFINGPQILFCDEPTGNLDNDTGREMIDLIFSLNQHKGTTLVLVTHDLELAARCGRIIRLKSGMVASDTGGPPHPA
jgi:putative ABC transport system ATP-binding protein